MESKILNLFLYNHKLKFSEIEKSLKIRSNKLSYHLKNLIKKKILIKKQDYYELAEDFEYIIPYISKKEAILPVVLIKIGDNKKCFLYQRDKRPYKSLLSLPGGRILIGESIAKTTKRIMYEKFSIKAELKKINSISIEHVKKKDKIIHSFLLILVQAAAKDQIKLINIIKNKRKIIPSDYKLIKSKPEKINIKTIYSNI